VAAVVEGAAAAGAIAGAAAVAGANPLSKNLFKPSANRKGPRSLL